VAFALGCPPAAAHGELLDLQPRALDDRQPRLVGAPLAFAELDDASGKPVKFYAYEVCDACEDDSFGYKIDGVLVSDFVYPAWFESFRPEGSTQFDRMNKIQTPFQLLVNGYIGIFNVTSGSGWQQETADKRPANVLHRGSVGTRRERRGIPHELWVNSLPQRKIAGNAQKYRQQLQTIQQRREAA